MSLRLILSDGAGKTKQKSFNLTEFLFSIFLLALLPEEEYLITFVRNFYTHKDGTETLPTKFMLQATRKPKVC